MTCGRANLAHVPHPVLVCLPVCVCVGLSVCVHISNMSVLVAGLAVMILFPLPSPEILLCASLPFRPIHLSMAACDADVFPLATVPFESARIYPLSTFLPVAVPRFARSFRRSCRSTSRSLSSLCAIKCPHFDFRRRIPIDPLASTTVPLSLR